MSSESESESEWERKHTHHRRSEPRLRRLAPPHLSEDSHRLLRRSEYFPTDLPSPAHTILSNSPPFESVSPKLLRHSLPENFRNPSRKKPKTKTTPPETTKRKTRNFERWIFKFVLLVLVFKHLLTLRWGRLILGRRWSFAIVVTRERSTSSRWNHTFFSHSLSSGLVFFVWFFSLFWPLCSMLMWEKEKWEMGEKEREIL